MEQVVDSNQTLQNKQMIKVASGTVPDIVGLKNAIVQKRSAHPVPNDAANAVPRMYVQDVKDEASFWGSTIL